MRRLLILTLPAMLTTFACDSDEGGGGDRNASIKALTGDVSAGETVFSGSGCNSTACHGADGDSGPSAPRLTDVVGMRTDDELINSVLDGRGNMPPQSLEDQQMADVLAWLRDSF
ncbi:MAG: c-type cytochrome [Myxococcota bacterium]